MKSEKNLVLTLFFAALIIGLFVSCKARQVVVKETQYEVVTETVRDTIFKTEKDSSFYRALIECRDGKAVITKVTLATAGKHLNAPKVEIKPDNTLEVDCEARAQELFAQWKEKNTIKQTVKEVPIITEKPLTGWQIVQMWAGRLFLFALVAILIYIAVKTRFNPFK